MIESWGTLSYELVLETLVTSAMFWVVTELATRFLRVGGPAWRARMFLLPVLAPIPLVLLVHLLVRRLFPGASSTPLEDLLASAIAISPVIPAVFLGMAGAVVLAGAADALKPLAAWVCLRAEWRAQRREESSLWLRCRGLLDSGASGLRAPDVKIVMGKHGRCGSLALGPLGSYIIVPESLARVLDDEELGSLLAHELGHIKRRDTLVGAMAGVCRHVLGFSPFAQWSYRCFSQAREEAVDDLAVRNSGRPLALASCLVKACRTLPRGVVTVVGSGFLASRGNVDRRIQRLMRQPFGIAAEPRRCGWCFYGTIAAVVAASLPTLQSPTGASLRPSF